MTASASTDAATGSTCAMNRDLLITISCSTGAAIVAG